MHGHCMCSSEKTFYNLASLEQIHQDAVHQDDLLKTDLSSALATHNFYKKEVIWRIQIINVYKSLNLKI